MSDQPSTPSELLIQLREQILVRYSDEELRTLCADLGIDYHDLPAESRAGKARELVAFLDRRGRLPELQRILARPPATSPRSSPSGGDTVGGDKVGGDKITVGNIGAGAVVSIGQGANASAGASQSARPQASKADILLVTVTEVEALAVLGLFQKEPGRKIERLFIGEKTYHDLGVIGGARVLMVQSEMGSAGLGGSLLTVEEGIRALSPSAVVMVGIAFGVNAKKQKVGDVLISQQLLLYELQRVGTESGGKLTIIPRGDRPHASTRLLDRFKSGALDWQEATVRFGLVLSGEKLVDNLDFRSQLRRFGPEAIGGEMEGAGMYVAAQHNKTDWILVKAICDWADGQKGRNKTQRQQKAAQSAARFTLHVIQQGGFAESGTIEGSKPLSANTTPLPNPFGDTGRITDPSRFFDREELLRQIFEELNKGVNLSLVGESQTGKSSLLSMVCALGPQKLNLPLEAFVYLSLQLVDNEDDFYEGLCAELGIEPCRGNKLFRELRGKRYVLCLDEVEKMKWEGFTVRVRSQLRGLADGPDAPLKLVIASRSPLSRLFPDSPELDSPLAGICHQLDVKPFLPDVARAFLAGRLRSTGVTFSESEVATLLAQSDGYPAKLQRAAADLYRQHIGHNT